ncbi:MAG TPA: hypothetical protein VGH38_07025 [Bryobacteraceae bacterium]
MGILLSQFIAFAALAMPDCRPAGPIGAGLRKLVREFGEARPGQTGSAAVQDFLIGVSGIPSASQAALVQRGPTHILAKAAGEGDLASDGPQALQFEGVFARTRTFFRVPQQIRAQYRASGRTLTIAYKEGAAIELGEAVPLVGVPVYRRINHVVITPDRLLFFWGSNASDEPDRCYVPSAN